MKNIKLIKMDDGIKLYKCRCYLFCLYELLEYTSTQIAKECGVSGSTIRHWLRKFNIRVLTMSESKTGKKNPNYGKTGEKHQNYGRHHSERSKKLISNSMKIRNIDENILNYNYGKFGKKASAWKGNDIGYVAIHYRAHKVQPKPTDGKCAICNQIADKKGITKLVHSNKDHTYRLPINPDEWWWIHESCHKKYDAKNRKSINF